MVPHFFACSFVYSSCVQGEGVRISCFAGMRFVRTAGIYTVKSLVSSVTRN